MSRRPRLTYSNIVATLALFIALGGTGIAASQLTGDDIKNNSLGSEDIKNKSLTGGDVKDKSLAGPDVKDNSIAGPDIAGDTLTGSDIREDALDTVPDAAEVGGNVVETALIKLSAGDSKQLFAKGPFTLSADCVDGGSGNRSVATFIETTEDGTVTVRHHDPTTGHPVTLGPGERRRIRLTSSSGGRAEWVGDVMYSAAAPSGARITGLMGLGANALGADCVVSVIGLGD